MHVLPTRVQKRHMQCASGHCAYIVQVTNYTVTK